MPTAPVPSEVAPSKNVTVPEIVPATDEATVAVNVTLAPAMDGFCDDARAVVVGALIPAFTACVSAGEVLPAKFASPLYFAVTECIPCVRFAVENMAIPPFIAIGVPSCVAPSKNVIVPVSVPTVVDVEVAVNMTLWPTVDGFSDETSAVVVVAVVAALTVCKIADDVAGANIASPLYMQEIEWLPWTSDDVVNVAIAWAFSIAAEPSWVAPSKKVTVPVGVPACVDVTAPVNITDCPTVDGFKDEVTVGVSAVPVDAAAVPVADIANGLFGAFVVMNTLPPVETPVRTSLVGAKDTLMVQLTPGPIEDGQLLVTEKFSEARTPLTVKAASPTLLNATA